MMKLNRHIWLLAAILGIGFVACKEDDTEISTITSFDKFTTTLPAPIVVAEADATHTINLTFDAKQIMDIHLSISTSPASTATEGVDFDLSTHEIAVTSLGGSASFDIIVHSDFEPEGDETVVLTIEGSDAFGLPTPVESLILTIRDSIYPVGVQLGWEGTFEYAGGTFTLCDNADVDMLLFDSNGDLVAEFGAATGACPENLIVGHLPDGTYSLMANLYNNGLFGAPDIDTIPIPLTVVLFRGGVVSDAASTFRYSTDNFPQLPVWTSYTPSDPDGAALVMVGTIRIVGGVVTLVNPDGTDVGTL
jgi:hypothetical protein